MQYRFSGASTECTIPTVTWTRPPDCGSIRNHGNVYIPRTVDRALRWILVTPDMHRVHHSIEYKETDSNFGFNLPWWDRLFGTYRAEPKRGHERMIIGQPECQDDRPRRLGSMLRSPFLSREDFKFP